ncbi:hypothetical protein DRH14_04305 [Candidatus Shapirobacteria bacterium]|nr:MAG: hypothetical protein DRH14_04305 [Candidatus Shapirobacteria bacterium]
MKNEVEKLIDEATETAKTAFEDREFYRAEALLQQIRNVGGNTPDTDHLLALSLHRQGKNQQAKKVLRPLAEEYKNWEYCNTLGVVHSVLRESESAIKKFRQACELNPQAVMAVNNLALEYQTIGKYDKAKHFFAQAVAMIDERDREQWAKIAFNIGNVYLDERQPEEAAKFFEDSKEKDPTWTPARWNLAAAYLMSKQYEKGWVEYESRFEQFPNFYRVKERLIERPAWEGEPLGGKTILLYAEQGAGDTIQFIRFTKHLKERGATVYLEWVNRYERGDLRTILERIEWIDRLINPEEEELYEDYDFDYHQSLASLPRVLQVNDESQFWYGPYIEPDTEFAPELQDHYWKPYEGKKKIGIVWAGSPSHHNDPKRSFPVTRFKPFVSNDVQLFSLQKDTRVRTWPGIGRVNLAEGMEDMPIVDLSPMMLDYNSTANLINKMDVIISVDTAVAHLAGAMGKEVYLMLPKVPDWRWGLGDRTAWYPTTKPFREDANDHFKRAANSVLCGACNLGAGNLDKP